MPHDRQSAFNLQGNFPSSWGRKAISPKVRYRALYLSNFSCRYCGRSAPDVILNVDHIWPVCLGGDNFPLNLICSCRDCNYGKSDCIETIKFFEKTLYPYDGLYIRKIVEKMFPKNLTIRKKVLSCMDVGCSSSSILYSIVDSEGDEEMCLEYLDTDHHLQVYYPLDKIEPSSSSSH